MRMPWAVHSGLLIRMGGLFDLFPRCLSPGHDPDRQYPLNCHAQIVAGPRSNAIYLMTLGLRVTTIAMMGLLLFNRRQIHSIHVPIQLRSMTHVF